MPTLITRAGKGSELTHNELDANFTRPVTQKTTTYSILISDNRSVIEGNHATVPFTITLPPVATAAAAETGDFEVTITNINAAVVSVDGSGSETIDGSTSVVALPQWGSVTCQLDSAQTGWKVVSRNNAGHYPFPATAVSSTNPNTLDDYEESNTYSVLLTADSSGTITVSSGYEALYTKMGRTVHIQGYINVASVSSPTGQQRMSLPFDPYFGAGFIGSFYVPIYISGLNTLSAGWYVGKIISGTATMQLRQAGDTAIADSEFVTSTQLRFSFSYAAVL